ncbi:MAG: haloalkane dehalogenase, partial [Gammaproteobacteria bacterium]
MSEILRTPDQRFAKLSGYAFAAHYLENLPGFEGIRIHYLDEGPCDANEVFLCLHGQPTWSYLYRRMIPLFTAAGGRAVAPDFIGFGRSDKPADEAFYTFTRHREMLLHFIERLQLEDITLVCHDWGGLLGLTLPMEMPECFKRLLVMNTALATGDVPLGKGFLAWRDWANRHPDMQIGEVIGRSCPHLTPQECGSYDSPYPDTRYKAGARRFPNLVCDRADADGAAVSRKARDWWKNQWRGESFMAIGLKDPIIGAPVMHSLRERIRDCPPPSEHQ